MSFDARSPIVEVASARVRIRSSTGGALAVKPARTGGGVTLTLRVSVESNGGPLPDRTVDLTLDGVEGSGGHLQHDGTMPQGSLSQSTVTTDASGFADVTYSADVFGGDVKVAGTSSGAAPALETITVRVPGLSQLSGAGNVEIIGANAWHASNHWATPLMITRIVGLADAFAADTAVSQGRKVRVNDMSLQLGGKFDLDTTGHGVPFYNPNGGHSEHREGKSADVRTHGPDSLTTAQQRFLREWWEGNYGTANMLVHPVGDPAGPHLHMKVP